MRLRYLSYFLGGIGLVFVLLSKFNAGGDMYRTYSLWGLGFIIAGLSVVLVNYGLYLAMIRRSQRE